MSIGSGPKLEECETCGRVYNTFVVQTCPRCAINTDS